MAVKMCKNRIHVGSFWVWFWFCCHTFKCTENLKQGGQRSSPERLESIDLRGLKFRGHDPGSRNKMAAGLRRPESRCWTRMDRIRLLRPAAKHGGGGVMMWACFGPPGPTEPPSVTPAASVDLRFSRTRPDEPGENFDT